jgi:hypothetical protein
MVTVEVTPVEIVEVTEFVTVDVEGDETIVVV